MKIDKAEKPILQELAEKDSEETSTFTCEICIEPALLTQKFHHKYNCLHNFCVMCIASHIQAKVDENIYTINCPGLECEQTLDPIECQPMIPPELFIKWCDCLCKSTVSGLKNCYCPYQQCSELILNECNETVKKCKCPRCNRLLCYNCKVPWHAGYRCNESNQQMDLNDRKFGFMIEQKKWTRCPYCGQPVERLSGCRSVLCRCGRPFCHNCGRKEHTSGRCDSENIGRRSVCCTHCMGCPMLIMLLGFIFLPICGFYLVIFLLLAR